MKSFLAAAVLLAITALGVGHSAAQTGTSSPGSIGTTSPLGSDFGQTFGNSQSAAQTGMSSPGGIGATSPLGADFGQTPGNNSQITPAPFTNPAPCERRFWRGRAIHLRRRRTEPDKRRTEPDNQFHDLRRRRRKHHVDAMQFGEQFRRHECPEFCGHDHIGRKFFLIAFIRIVE